MNMNATIFGQAIAFILFVWFCMNFVWPPIIRAIEKRQKEITDSLALAEQAKKEVELTEANIEEVMQKAKAEAFAIIEQANKRREEMLEKAKKEAESEKEKIIKQGFAELDVERKRTQDELRKQVVILALAGAEKIIERSIDKAANSDIIDKLTAEL